MKSPNELRWVYEIPLLKNFTVLRGILIVLTFSFGLTFLIITMIFFLKGNSDRLVMILPGLGLAYLFVTALLLGSAWLLVGNKYPVEFIVTEEGIGYRGLSKRFETIQKYTKATSFGTGNTTLMGSSLLASDKDVYFIPWKDIRNIQFEANKNRITVIKSFLIRIYIYPESGNFSIVKSFISSHFPAYNK